jgi:hypothetical protein
MNPDEHDDPQSETLDGLYEALGEVQAHRHQHDQEREQLKQQVLEMEKGLQEQRQAAVAAGERGTYERLSQELATLARAWRALNDDPDADPLEQYQPDESEPDDQPQQEDEDAETGPDHGDSGAPGVPGHAAEEAGPGDRGAGDQGQADARGGGEPDGLDNDERPESGG